MMVTEQPETTLAWSAIVAFVVLSIIVPFHWQQPTRTEIALAALIGVGSAGAHALFVFAFERAQPSLIAPFTYTQIVWTTWLGFVVLGTTPDGWTLIGMAVIVVSGIYTARRP
jgi:drug/metabolite transporter (DMT)-like permease